MAVHASINLHNVIHPYPSIDFLAIVLYHLSYVYIGEVDKVKPSFNGL